jgi:hypothetical protein
MQLELAPGSQFFSLAEGVLVIEGHNIDWLSCAGELDHLINTSASSTFIFYRPWAPRTRRKVEHFTGVFGRSSDDMAPVQFVTFSEEATIFAQVLKLVAAMERSSGVWRVGSCIDFVGLERCIRSSDYFTDDALFIAAACVKWISTVLVLDEGGRSYLFVARANENASSVRSVIDSLRNVADDDQTG